MAVPLVPGRPEGRLRDRIVVAAPCAAHGEPHAVRCCPGGELCARVLAATAAAEYGPSGDNCLMTVPFNQLMGGTDLLIELHAEAFACYGLDVNHGEECKLAFGTDLRLGLDDELAPVVEAVFKVLLGDAYGELAETKDFSGSCISPDADVQKLLQEAASGTASSGE